MSIMMYRDSAWASVSSMDFCQRQIHPLWEPWRPQLAVTTLGSWSREVDLIWKNGSRENFSLMMLACLSDSLPRLQYRLSTLASTMAIIAARMRHGPTTLPEPAPNTEPILGSLRLMQRQPAPITITTTALLTMTSLPQYKPSLEGAVTCLSTAYPKSFQRRPVAAMEAVP
jgi:hypothetical protein